MGRQKRRSVSQTLLQGKFTASQPNVEKFTVEETSTPPVTVTLPPGVYRPRPRTVTVPAGRWMRIDTFFAAVDQARHDLLAPHPRPITPASDAECYALNPPRYES